jgi:hypothetical protein
VITVTARVPSTVKLPSPLLTPAHLREVGLFIRERIVSRTRGGQDVRGGGFAAYSPRYAAQKFAELGTSRVDLTVSGNLLNEITILNVTTSSVSLGWAGTGGGGARGKMTFIQRSRETPSAAKAAWNNETREFWGVSAADEAAVVAMVDRMIQERLNER